MRKPKKTRAYPFEVRQMGRRILIMMILTSNRKCSTKYLTKKLRCVSPEIARLERLKKYCSHSGKDVEEAVFLIFGFVSAQSQGLSNLFLRQSLAKNQKSSLRNGYSISLTALNVARRCHPGTFGHFCCARVRGGSR
jgi:hypothetical protein